MKKIKISKNFAILIIFCAIFNKFLIFFNYFVALMIHELAHFSIASKRGYKLREFKIDIFGCALSLDEEVEDSDSFAVNIAGPIANLFLCLVCMSLYYLFPSSYNVLNTFCLANLVLALFNLLPIYPLDGGKIFRSFIKGDKTYARLDLVLRLVLTVLFLVLFICSCMHTVNYFYLIMCIFFATSKGSRRPTFSIFKSKKSRSFQKVQIVKISGQETLLKIIKHIKSHRYTIFYLADKKRYLDEDEIVSLSLIYPLTTKIEATHHE